MVIVAERTNARVMLPPINSVSDGEDGFNAEAQQPAHSERCAQ
jgi:hypothetical protein